MFRADFVKANRDAVKILKRLEVFARISPEPEDAQHLFRAQLYLDYEYLKLRTDPILYFKRWERSHIGPIRENMPHE